MADVYCLHDDELLNLEFNSKGYRNDIFVKVNNLFYQLNIYDIVRLNQDFDSEVSEYGYYQVEPNLIIVHELTEKEIKTTIDRLVKQNFFENLRPVSNIHEYELKIF